MSGPNMRISVAAPAAAAVLSAALLVAAFPPFSETASAAFALAPMLAAARLASPGKAAWTWFGGGFAFWFATLAWMPAICKNNGPWPLVVLGWLGLSALCAGYFALFGWLDAHAWKRCGRWGLAFEPVLWAGTEWLRGWLFTGFAWNFLGTALGPVPDLLAPARIGGVYLVSAAAILVNGVFTTLLCRVIAQMRRSEERQGQRWTRSLETALPLAAVLLLFWAARAPSGADAGQLSIPLRVALVQRNAPCVFRAGTEREHPLAAYGRLMEAAAPAKPHLVVWGESAMAEFGRLESSAAMRVAEAFARRTGGAALVAGGDYRAQTNGEVRVYNGAGLYAIDGSNTTLQVYCKQHLVPFGEYIPFDKWITPLQRLSPIGLSLHPGEAKVLETKADGATVKIAPLICFEDTVPALARRGARLGAQAIVLITNDSWFSDSWEAEQHAAQAVLRAVETGLPVIRTGNSGVTGIIEPSGRTRWLTDGNGRPLVDAPGCQLETVKVQTGPRLTPYTRFGDWPLLVLFIASIAGLFMVKYRHANDR